MGDRMQNSERLLALAKRQFNRREYHLAEDLINFVLKDDETNLDARLLMAKTLDRAGRRNLAITQLEIIKRLCRSSRQSYPEADELLKELDHENALLLSDNDGIKQAQDQEPGALDFQKMEAPEGDPRNGIRASRGISPYFGFQEKLGENLNNYGFWIPKKKTRIDYPYTPAPDEFTVGIFGGSVASGFCQDEAVFIEQRLSEHPDLRGRTPVVLNFAAGAVKQPQQLFYLNYFLGLGQKFDLVVNIDGFNDVPGAVANTYNGFHPAMPQALLLKSFDALASVPRLDRKSLKYFSRLARAESRQMKMNQGFWKHLLPNAIRNRQQAIIDRMRRQPPEEMEVDSLLEVQRVGEKDYLRESPDGKQEIRDQVLNLWKNYTRLMIGACNFAGVPYIHVIQPNQNYCKKDMTGADAVTMTRGHSRLFKAVVQDCWPEMIEFMTALGESGPLYCHMTDVMDDLSEDVLADSDCHFNARGHRAMSERLCAYLGETAFAEAADERQVAST
jgi:hypothetical protein